MNLTLEQLYKLRHALNVAAVHDEIFVNDEVIKAVAEEISDKEDEIKADKDFDKLIDVLERLDKNDTSCQDKRDIFQEFFRSTKLG